MKRVYNVASFFSGCGGLDYGFHNDKFNILFANDIWKDAVESFKLNYPNVTILQKSITDFKEEEIKKILKGKQVDILIGGPPCQCFTRLNNNQLIRLSEEKKEDDRRKLSKVYIQMVKLLHPKIVVMENVKDMLIRKNNSGEYYKDIIINEFRKIGYSAYFKIVHMEKHKIAEKRTRVIFFATNLKKIINKIEKNPNYVFPDEKETITVSEVLSEINTNQKLENNYFVRNEPNTLIKIKNIPPGGYYEDLPDHLKTKKVRNGKLVIVKRYGSYLRRLHPNKQSPTITRNYLIHPSEDRYLSNREKAIVHGFPINYKFYGMDGSVCQQIANAVPPLYSIQLSQKIFNILNE